MKVRDIFKEPVGSVIPEFTARIVKVYPPSQQSDRQAKTGIHNQTVMGQGADGTELKIRIIKGNLHMPTTEAGRLYTFKSTNDDRGRMGGIVTCEWTKDSGEKEFYIEINGQAHFYAVNEEGPAVVANRPAQHANNNTGRMPAGKDDFTPSVMDHVEFYGSIVDAMEKRLAGSQIFDALLKDPAPLLASCTSIFIQSTQNGTFRRNWKPVVTTGGQYEPSHEEQGEMLPQSQQSPDDGEAQMVDYIMIGNWNAADEHAPKCDPERVYDLLCERLTAGGKHPQTVIDAAFDHVKKKISSRTPATSRQTCEAIMMDSRYFITTVEQAQAAWDKKNKPAPPPAEEAIENVFDESLLAQP